MGLASSHYPRDGLLVIAPIADRDNALRKLAPYIRPLDMALCGKEITTYLDLALATPLAPRAEVAWEYHSEPEADLEFS